MKLCSGLLLSVGVTGQSDRWSGSYDYVDAFNYGGKIIIEVNFQGYYSN